MANFPSDSVRLVEKVAGEHHRGHRRAEEPREDGAEQGGTRPER
jgi:hypothetical protein